MKIGKVEYESITIRDKEGHTVASISDDAFLINNDYIIFKKEKIQPVELVKEKCADNSLDLAHSWDSADKYTDAICKKSKELKKSFEKVQKEGIRQALEYKINHITERLRCIQGVETVRSYADASCTNVEFFIDTKGAHFKKDIGDKIKRIKEEEESDLLKIAITARWPSKNSILDFASEISYEFMNTGYVSEVKYTINKDYTHVIYYIHLDMYSANNLHELIHIKKEMENDLFEITCRYIITPYHM